MEKPSTSSVVYMSYYTSFFVENFKLALRYFGFEGETQKFWSSFDQNNDGEVTSHKSESTTERTGVKPEASHLTTISVRSLPTRPPPSRGRPGQNN